MAKTMSKRHLGSSLDDLLKAEGTFEEMEALSVKEVRAWPRNETKGPLRPGLTNDGT